MENIYFTRWKYYALGPVGSAGLGHRGLRCVQIRELASAHCTRMGSNVNVAG